MSQPIKQRLESSLDSAAASGRKIASYMLANLHELPFQTSASIAAKLGVSESSVGRFCRSLGYAHLKALKQDLQNDLGDGPWLVGDRLQDSASNQDASDCRRQPGAGNRRPGACARIQPSPAWHRGAPGDQARVFIAGFQTERGIAMCMVHLLQYLRDGVHWSMAAPGTSAKCCWAARRQRPGGVRSPPLFAPRPATVPESARGWASRSRW
jgi:hypothetical protein